MVKLVIILCFYGGLAAFPGKTVENTYKILLVIFSLIVLLKSKGLSGIGKKELFLIISFILFSASFFFSAVINEDYFNLIFSQYGKYITPICLFFVMNRILNFNIGLLTNLKILFFYILTIQIILSFVKIPTIGLQETVVGSLASVGGGPATILPVLGFILLWLHKDGVFRRNDWIYTFLLIFIAFASLKRAIWFIMPTFIILFMYYIPRRIRFSHVLYALPIIPFIFYAGVRLNPTLNKEGKMGGSFDIQFVLNYAQSYNFGKTENTPEIQAGTGRGGATYLLFHKLFSSTPLKFEDYWGAGLREVYTTDYDEFNEEKYGVDSKGAVTGVFQSYISSGYIGIALTILLIISICNLIKEPRIRNSVALLMFWDYFFYIGLILRTQGLFILLFFLILYSNIQYDQMLYHKYMILKKDDKKRNLQREPAFY